MQSKYRLFLSWAVGTVLTFGVFYAAISWLWSAAQKFGALSLENQVVSALTNDLAEGNLFKLGATLSKLQHDGHLHFAEIRYFDGSAQGGRILFATKQANDQTDVILASFRCEEQRKIIQSPIGGINLITKLPTKVAGSECVALFISSDLPPALKLLKNRLISAFGLLFAVLFALLLWLTLSWYRRLLDLETANRVMQLEKESAIGRITAQVAHDIRSPLAALDSVMGSVSRLPEEERLIIRDAVNRIKDIANHLLEKNHQKSGGDGTDKAREGKEAALVCLLSSLIEPLITEKRLQFGSQGSIEIHANLDSFSYGHFAKLEPREFKRVLSNLVNNAVEALGEKGSVAISLAHEAGKVLIKIQDSGKGIPPEILSKLGQKGETHGKAGGSGLGLYHTRTSLARWGGTLDIQSETGKGTTVTIILPHGEPPSWFVSQLEILPGSTIIVLDDDPTIHQVWQGRFKALRVEDHGIQIFHFSRPDELRQWVKAQPLTLPSPARGEGKEERVVYLTDYELLGFKETGLALIEELNLGSQAILVTSRYEEPAILENCQRLKVRLIPKGLAGFVPLSLRGAQRRSNLINEIASGLSGPRNDAGKEIRNDNSKECDAVLIDDDALVHLTWKMAAKRAGKKILAFTSVEEFFGQAMVLSRNIPIYIDSRLGNGVKGEEESLKIYDLGFQKIYLATGGSPEKFAHLKHIRGVLGKEPPWVELLA